MGSAVDPLHGIIRLETDGGLTFSSSHDPSQQYT